MTFEDMISTEIDQYCSDTLYKPFSRTHMGASSIGRECAREIWYGFRKVLNVNPGGRMQRLFLRGNEEEGRVKKWLEGIGLKIFDRDEDGKQFTFSAIKGHMGGSCDALAKLPERYRFYDNLLIETKTANDANFKLIKKNKLLKEKPEHYVQMCLYGFAFKCEYGLYIVINKNDDDIYIELVKLDHEVAMEHFRKAEYLIDLEKQPDGISQDGTFYKCKMCSYNNICHYGAPQEKNCFSCKNAKPTDEGKWICRFQNANAEIPPDMMKDGCQYHEGIVN